MTTEVSSSLRDTQPYYDIGIIFVTFPDGTSMQGTCSLIGRNDILTATHVIYSPDHGGWANNFKFYFGADYNNIYDYFEDYGNTYSPDRWIVNGWPDQAFTDSNNKTMLQSEVQFDVAIIGVDDPIGDTLGWLGLDTGYNTSNMANAVGYPADSTGMMHETVLVHDNPYYGLYESDYDVMGPGSSGGPLLMGDYVIGVKSTSMGWADIGFVYDQLIDLMEENNSLLTDTIGQTIYGTTGDDTLSGEEGDDFLSGGDGDDWLEGSTGNDILDGGAGNDLLSGGGGVDIAVYNGDIIDFLIFAKGDEYIINDLDSTNGQEGRDILLDVEQLQFNNEIFAIADAVTQLDIIDNDSYYWDAMIGLPNGDTVTAHEAQLYRTYFGALQRTPDNIGYDWWLNEIQNGRQDLYSMAAGFIWSDEFLAAVNAPDGNSISNDAFLTHMYEGIFGRDADSSGYNWWLNELNSDNRDQVDVLVDMTQSNEYVEITLTGTVDYVFDVYA